MLRNLPQILVTFLLVAVGWVIFRSATITEGFGYLTRLATELSCGHLGGFTMGKMAVVWCLLMVALEWLQRDKRHVLQLPARGLFRYRTCRWLLYDLLLLLIILMHGEEQTFIYFQF